MLIAQALAGDPGLLASPLIRRSYIELLIALDRREHALRTLEELLGLFPGDPELLALLRAHASGLPAPVELWSQLLAGCASVPATPLVSVLVVASDDQEALTSTLLSVLDQDYPSLEVLVSASSGPGAAGTDQRLSEHARSHCARVLPRGHQGAEDSLSALCALVDASRGDYLVPLAAGDRLYPDCVSSVVACWRGTGSSLISLNGELVDDEGSFLGKTAFPMMTYPTTPLPTLLTCPPSHPLHRAAAQCFSRQLIQAFPLVPASYPGFQLHADASLAYYATLLGSWSVLPQPLVLCPASSLPAPEPATGALLDATLKAVSRLQQWTSVYQRLQAVLPEHPTCTGPDLLAPLQQELAATRARAEALQQLVGKEMAPKRLSTPASHESASPSPDEIVSGLADTLQTQEALARLSLALESHPELARDQELVLMHARLLLQVGRAQQAQEVLEAHLSHEPMSLRTLNLLDQVTQATQAPSLVQVRERQPARAGEGQAPLVTIVVHAHNASATVEDSLDSVLAQSYSPLQVIVCDGGSTDDTLAKVASRLQAGTGSVNVQVVSAQGRGPASPARSLQHACTRAEGAYFVEVQATSTISPTTVEEMMATLLATDAFFVLADAEPAGLESRLATEACARGADPLNIDGLRVEQPTRWPDDATVAAGHSRLLLEAFPPVAGNFPEHIPSHHALLSIYASILGPTSSIRLSTHAHPASTSPAPHDMPPPLPFALAAQQAEPCRLSIFLQWKKVLQLASSRLTTPPREQVSLTLSEVERALYDTADALDRGRLAQARQSQARGAAPQASHPPKAIPPARRGATPGRRFNKVFGIGSNKTGTTSLEAIFHQLGLDVAPQADGEMYGLRGYKGDLEGLTRFVERHEAFQDAPFSIGWTFAQLDALFPGSKFILTHRSPETWFSSLLRFHRKGLNVPEDRKPTREDMARVLYLYPGYFEHIMELGFMVDVDDDLKTSTRWDLAYTESFHVEQYIERNRSIARHFASRPDDLLVIDLTKEPDTRKIVEFLGLPSSLVSEVPHMNKT